MGIIAFHLLHSKCNFEELKLATRNFTLDGGPGVDSVVAPVKPTMFSEIIEEQASNKEDKHNKFEHSATKIVNQLFLKRYDSVAI